MASKSRVKSDSRVVILPATFSSLLTASLIDLRINPIPQFYQKSVGRASPPQTRSPPILARGDPTSAYEASVSGNNTAGQMIFNKFINVMRACLISNGSTNCVNYDWMFRST